MSAPRSEQCSNSVRFRPSPPFHFPGKSAGFTPKNPPKPRLCTNLCTKIGTPAVPDLTQLSILPAFFSENQLICSIFCMRSVKGLHYIFVFRLPGQLACGTQGV